MTTISDYISSTRAPFPFMESDYQGKDSIVSTEDFQNMLTDFLDMNFGSLELSPVIERRINSTHSIADVVRRMCTIMYKANAYRYTTLYATTQEEYNPIENYSMVEHIETEYQGKENNSHTENGTNVSRETLSNTISDTTAKTGTDKIEVTVNSVTNDDVEYLGNETDTLTKTGTDTHNRELNDGHKTMTHSVAPNDSTTFYNETQDDSNQIDDGKDDLTITYNSTDTTTKAFTNRKDERKTINANDSDTLTTYDSSTATSRTDTATNERDNTITNSVSEVKEFTNRKDIISHTRSGNIGVTTTQQMLQSERELAEFNFLSIVAHDVVKQIAICVY